MKALIFKSEVTKAVYYWNGQDVITVEKAYRRPLGGIMNGIEKSILENAYKVTKKSFMVGGSKYIILKKIIVQKDK